MSAGGERRWRRGRPSILAGRLIASLITAFFLVLAIAQGPDASAAELTGLLVLLGLTLLSVAVAWRSAGLGSLALMVLGLGLAVFIALTADRNQTLLALVLGGPYVLAGALIWFGASRMASA